MYFCALMLIDSHTHLYLDAFNDDRAQVVQQAIDSGVGYMLLPGIDSHSLDAMKQLHKQFPAHCLPMMGLHPTSVKDQYEAELNLVEKELDQGGYIAVGEIGIDLYWDKTHREQQADAFRRQLQLAKKHKLPVSIHTRDAFETVYSIVKEEVNDDLKGVFHCFTGNETEAGQIADLGFLMGIGGVVTFRNSGLAGVVKQIPMEFLILETDAPFLTPVPYRGKRNQSSYLTYIAAKLAEIKGCRTEDIAVSTSGNAATLFNLEH